MWTRFLPPYSYLKQQLDEKTIGDVKVVQATFGLKMDDVPRVSDPKLGGSVLLDIGVYTLNVADMVFGGERPQKIDSSGHLFDTGVDHTVGVSMLYSNKRMAHIFYTAGIFFEVKIPGVTC